MRKIKHKPVEGDIVIFKHASGKKRGMIIRASLCGENFIVEVDGEKYGAAAGDIVKIVG